MTRQPPTELRDSKPQGTPGPWVQMGSPAEDLVKRLGNERGHGGRGQGGSRDKPGATVPPLSGTGMEGSGTQAP